MFNRNFSFTGYKRRILTSAAAIALISAGAAGEFATATSLPAHAASVETNDLKTQGAPSFATLIERVKPAVVSVKVVIQNASAEAPSASGETLPPSVQQFLKRFGGNDLPQGSQPQAMIGMGSGFFVSSDGYIVTNNHVVQNAKTVSVTMDSGKTLSAHVVGADPSTDIAVIKVDQAGDYPFVSLAKTAPRVGDWVVAIGNPFGLGGTVTAGIVSAEGRDIGQGPYDRFIQIDAPINKGNSGGPTFNLEGQVVGINTAIYSPSGGSVGVGFDIPSTTAQAVVDALEHGGKIERGFLGVAVQPVSQEVADGLGLTTAEGALVDQVTPNTPAAEAGLKPGDVILKMNGEAVKDAADLTRRVGSLKPGDKAELAFQRDGAAKTVSVTLGAHRQANVVASADHSDTAGAPTLGVKLAPAGDVSGAGDNGVVIVNVDPNGAGAAHGLAEGNVILEVAGKPVSNVNDVKAGMAAARQEGKKAVLLRVQTAAGDHFIAIPFPKA